jgi:uncharacterized protein
MFVLCLRVQLHLPVCRSLKDRRQVVKPIVEGARQRFRVSVAEVGRLDRWQWAEIGFAVVSGEHHHAVTVIDEVERFVWSFPEVEVVATERSWLDDA